MVPAYQTPRPGLFPPGLTAEYPDGDAASSGTEWFRFGDGYLGLQCDHAGFRARFSDLYRECRVDAPAPVAGAVRCFVSSLNDGERVRAVFEDPEPLDQIPFAMSALAEFDFAEAPSPGPGQRMLRSPSAPGSIVFDATGFVADADSPWPTIAGALSIHRVLRLQRRVLFFHAAAVGIGGRGLLLMGPKEAGKTTLSLALASRGHQFFSDEMSAVRRDSLEILPFRRRLSIRPGPAADEVSEVLAARPFPVVELADGTLRTRAQPAELCVAALGDLVRASAICFLRSKLDRPRAERFTPATGDLRLLAPYESATWGQPPAQLALGMLRLLSRVRCYHLDAGPIADTARLIEALMMEA